MENIYRRNDKKNCEKTLYKFSEKEREVLEKFYRSRVADNVGFRRLYKVLSILLLWKTRLFKNKKMIHEITLDDIQDGLYELSGTSLAKNTQRDYRIILRCFVEFIHGFDSKEYKSIKMIGYSRSLHAEEPILVEEDIIKIIETATNSRDKAIFCMLWEAGFRASELLTIKIKNLRFEKQGIKVRVDGKTGKRTVLIISSEPYIVNLLSQHPKRNNPESHLFLTTRGGRPLHYQALRKIISKAKKKSGTNKRITAHWFRHSSVSDKAKKGWNQALLSKFYGWSQGSKMANTYIHLNGEDLDNSVLRYHGLEEAKKTFTGGRQAKICSRCSEKCGFAEKHCSHCGASLDIVLTPKSKNKGKKEYQKANKKLFSSFKKRLLEELRHELMEELKQELLA